MAGLEIALFVLGAAFIVISFFIVEGSSGNGKQISDGALARETLRRISADAIEDMNHKSDLLLAESEDKLEALSNDKIIAVGEYSDQILEKINSNHKEVVFLYQMLNEKEESLKSTANKLESVRIECERLIKSEMALEAQRANAGNAADRSGMMTERRQTYPSERSAMTATGAAEETGPITAGYTAGTGAAQAAGTPAGVKTAQTAGISAGTKSTQTAGTSAGAKTAQTAGTPTGAKTAQTAGTAQTAKTGSRTKGQDDPAAVQNTARRSAGSAASNAIRKNNTQPQPRVSIEAEGKDNSSLSRNEEVLAMHRQGRSVMEISKLLGMGQGEVKLIINLYG